jgi:hypothetical protein
MNIQESFKGLDTPKGRLGYIKPYKNNFEMYKDKVKVFCELGVNAGQSLIGWGRYFPDAIIVGIDLPTNRNCRKFASGNKIHPSHKAIHDQIKIEWGDAMNQDWLKEVAAKYGGFDIVLDDCSHEGIQMQTSFEALWESTKYCYAVEDLETQFGKHGPSFTEKGNFITGHMQSIIKKGKITEKDVRVSSKWESPDPTIRKIKFEHNVVFIHKEPKGRSLSNTK